MRSLIFITHTHKDRNIYYYNIQELPESFRQSGNGYKPCPIKLTGHLDTPLLGLVNKLAENTHNVWSLDKIKRGWTYGLSEVSPVNDQCGTVKLRVYCIQRECVRRSDKLLPFSMLKKCDRECSK